MGLSARPEMSSVESLQIEVDLSPQQAHFGGRIRISVPATLKSVIDQDIQQRTPYPRYVERPHRRDKTGRLRQQQVSRYQGIE